MPRREVGCKHMRKRIGIMDSGRVKWFNKHNGYAYIELDRGPGILVHLNARGGAGRENLVEGDRVSFEHNQGRKIARIRKL